MPPGPPAPPSVLLVSWQPSFRYISPATRGLDPSRKSARQARAVPPRGVKTPHNRQQPRPPRQTSGRTGCPSGPKPLWVSTHQYAAVSYGS